MGKEGSGGAGLLPEKAEGQLSAKEGEKCCLGLFHSGLFHQ
jgi:hypothetical protein